MDKKNARTPTAIRLPAPGQQQKRSTTGKKKTTPTIGTTTTTTKSGSKRNDENAEPNTRCESPSSLQGKKQQQKPFSVTPSSAGQRMKRLSLHGVNPMVTPAAAIVLGATSSSPGFPYSGYAHTTTRTPSTSALKVPKLKRTPIENRVDYPQQQLLLLQDDNDDNDQPHELVKLSVNV